MRPASEPGDEPADYTPDPRRWKALAVCLVAGFMSLLDVSIVNVALPAIKVGLHATQSDLQWVVSGYALTFGFEQMLIQRGAVGPNSAEVLTTFSYIYGIVNGNYSYGAAAGLFLGVTSLILILAANRVAHAFGEDGLYRR